MRFPAMLVLALGLTVSSTSVLPARASTSDAADTLRENQIIVALGNSITQLGDSPRGYVTLIRKVLHLLSPEKDIIIVNSGISGHKATDMAERFDRDVIAFQPDWVTISVGINDVWHGFYDNHPLGDGPRGIPLALFRQKVTEMVEKAHAHGIRVALFTTTVIKENLDSPENRKLTLYNDALRAIAKSHGCLLVDQNSAFRHALTPLQRPGLPDNGALTVDGVHMLPAGDWLMAQTTLEAFGISSARLAEARTQIDKEADREENEWNPAVDRPGEKHVLLIGAPDARDGFVETRIPDGCFSIALRKGESTRQVTARLKRALTEKAFTSAVVFIDGCRDFQGMDEKLEAESRVALAKMFSLAAQYQVPLLLVEPSGSNGGGGGFRWIEDSCRTHGTATFKAADGRDPVPQQLERWIDQHAGQPLIEITPGSLFPDSQEVRILPLLAGGEIHVTIDGSEPVESSPIYTAPLRLTATTTVKARVWFGGGDSSIARVEQFEKAAFLPPAVLARTSAGLRYNLFEGTWTHLPSFDSLQPVQGGVVESLDLSMITARSSDWGAVIAGYVEVPEDDIYNFLLTSDDGSRLTIDGRLVVDNDGLHGPVTEEGKIALRKGKHAFRLAYFQGGGGEFLRIEWQTATGGKTPVPSEAFSH